MIAHTRIKNHTTNARAVKDMSSVKSTKVKRLVNKAKHSSTLLARHVESLHSRFNLRRVIIAADKRSVASHGRSPEDLETIHRFVCSETRIAELWSPWAGP